MLCGHVCNSHDHSVYTALILQGEIWCWSLLGLKGLNAPIVGMQQLIYVLAVLCVNYLSLKYGMFVLNKLNLQYWNMAIYSYSMLLKL